MNADLATAHFNTKTLLVLGASTDEISLVKYARHLGLRVIVTDNHVDHRLAPAKFHADEAWDISWSDMKQLVEKCKTCSINGIVAGYSEFRVENAIKLCGILGLPFYSTLEQLEITRNKRLFKQTCLTYGVPVVNEYADVADVKEFPVIVKPVDRGGSIGVSIAHNFDELKRCYAYALDQSVCKDVIIEDYITDGEKIDFCYIIIDGRIELAHCSDTLHATKNAGNKVVQSAWLFPERHLQSALEKVDMPIRAMIKGMGIKNGYIFYSGFVRPNKEMMFFECGFRLGGGHQYEYMYRTGAPNSLEMMISYAISGSMENVARSHYCNPNLKCVTLNFYALRGVVGRIEGLNEVATMRDCASTVVYARPGMRCGDGQAILQKLAMFSFVNENPEELRKSAKCAYNTFKVLDENGVDMIYDRIDVDLIPTWWDERDRNA